VAFLPVFVIRFASIDFSASACRRDSAAGSLYLNELDMTEPQPSRSVKRPTQSFSKLARCIEASARLGPALPPNPPGYGLPKNPGAGSRIPSISDSPSQRKPLLPGLADFRLELAEAIESYGENWFSWGNRLTALADHLESRDWEGISQNQ
jgi:hypothetical protein